MPTFHKIAAGIASLMAVFFLFATMKTINGSGSHPIALAVGLALTALCGVIAIVSLRQLGSPRG